MPIRIDTDLPARAILEEGKCLCDGYRPGGDAGYPAA